MKRALLSSTTLVIAIMLHAMPSPAQEVTPTSILIDEATKFAPVCQSASASTEACITLPPEAVIDRVDVFFLFDDTGSFAGFVPTVASIFSGLVSDLQSALPSVDFGFGVGRFEDYGGPGTGFSGEFVSGRPFVLNQPIVTSADASAASTSLTTLINDALARTADGFGGDGPESAIAEGLFQVATGVGFDGDGDGLTTGVGGTQVAGALATQTAADNSGDVPAFTTLDSSVVSSGFLGGAGFRAGALRLVLLATDICSISAFDSTTGIPATITGTGGAEPVGEFACSSTDPGVSRFGFVSDSLTAAGNTIAGAVVPLGAGTVLDAVAALNAAGIRVLGMGPGSGPVPSGSGPSFDPSVFLSALARLTGGVDEFGQPLVFDIGGGGDPLKDAIVAAIETSVTLPIDINLMASAGVPSGLSVSITPPVVEDVAPGEQACFDVEFTGSNSPMGMFDLDFKDDASGAVLGTIPTEATCDVEIEVVLDVKPTSCPNPINCRSKGTLPAAVLGTASFDVSQIDPSSIRLGGIAPQDWAFEDVAAPADLLTGKEDCDLDCTTAGPDGFVDLTLKFDNQEIVSQISGVDRLCLVLQLTGNLKPEFGGTPIVGEDVVRFQCK